MGPCFRLRYTRIPALGSVLRAYGLDDKKTWGLLYEDTSYTLGDNPRVKALTTWLKMKQCLQQVRSSEHVEGEPDGEVFEARRGSTCFP